MSAGTTHSETEESAFMADLLAGIDDSFFDAVPSPDQPTKTRKTPVISPRSPYERRRQRGFSPQTNKSLYNTPTKPKVEHREKQSPGTYVGTIDSLLDGAENWDWDDMNTDFMTPKKAVKRNLSSCSVSTSRSSTLFSEVSTQKPTLAATSQIDPLLDDPRPPSIRCIVKEVRVINDDGFFHKELIVAVQSSSELRRVTLRDDWFDTRIRHGDTINVIGSFMSVRSCSSQEFQSATPPSPLPSRETLPYIELTSQPTSGLLVLHPDLLITATSLSSSPTCLRKPILASLIHSSSDITPALVWGNMLHEIIQSCLIDWTKDGIEWDEREIDRKVEKEVKRGLGDLLRLNVSVDQAKRELKLRAIGLKAFRERYIHNIPKPNAVLTNTRSERGQSSLLAISSLHDIEEDIWSPKYGLKGKLDVSVQVIIEDTSTNVSHKSTQVSVTSGPTTKARKNAPLRPSESISVASQTHPSPLELKTGRSTQVMEHRAQTILYTLLMEERYGTPVPSGLLYYTQSDEVVRVPRTANEMRALIQKRNEMAGYFMRRASADDKYSRNGPSLKDVEDFLPPTINDARVCGRCYVVDTCMLYRKAVQRVQDTSSSISDIYALKTSHITPTQAEFFKTWEHLISLEEQDLVRFRKELWTMTAKERETHGRCFAEMVLDEEYQHEIPALKSLSKREGRIHQFTYRFVKASSLLGIYAPGDSLLNGHMSVGDAVTVSVEPDLLALVRGFIVSLTPSDIIIGVDHELSMNIILARRPPLGRNGSLVAFRIDKDELFGGMGRIRGNLAALFHADGDTQRLELVVDLRAPRFITLPPGPLAPPHDPVTKVIELLNKNQKAAVNKVLGSLDYSLILGMPGTGKTTVIASLILLLVTMGKSVLLTSYTHSAVDTILLKLKDVDFRILRLGNVDKIHPDVYKFTLAAIKTATTIEQLENQVMSPPVVATTCLSIDHPLFSRRKFDYCIVDEASQVTLPTCLGPLRLADRFVLVGDHFQLPPLVRSREAKRGGLDVSLFKRLSEAHPDAVVDLNEQYRMNEDIMLLSNRLIYSDRLLCGSEAVAKRSLILPNIHFLDKLHGSATTICSNYGCWIGKLLENNCKAVFVDTDDVPARDSRIGDLTQNVTEATLVHQLTDCLVGCGLPEEDIGVITLYRQQIKLLSHFLQDRSGIEILTADRSQGRDKECIIISMVRSNDAGQVGDLLKDWRRINVSFTRARSKLIIIGSRNTLQTEPLLQEFFELMESKDWILRLPPGADTTHPDLVPRPPLKRSVTDDQDTSCPRNPHTPSRPAKKARNGGNVDEGLVKGRPILRDLVNGSL